MDKNTFYALIAMMVIIFLMTFVWEIFFPTPQRETPQPQQELENERKTETTAEDESHNTESREKESGSDIKAITDFQFKRIPVEAEGEKIDDYVTYESKTYKIVFSTHDAVIKKLYLKPDVKKKNKKYEIIHFSESIDGGARLLMGSMDEKILLKNIIDDGNDQYYLQKIENDSFLFTYKMKNIQSNVVYTISKRFQFHPEEYIFYLDIDISSDSRLPVQFSKNPVAYTLTWGPGLGMEMDKKNRRMGKFGQFYLPINKKDIVSPKFKKGLFGPRSSTVRMSSSDMQWPVSMGHYLATVLIPDSNNYSVIFDQTKMEDERYFVGLERKTKEGQVKSSFKIFVGPKSNKVLTKYNKVKNNKLDEENLNLQILNKKWLDITGIPFLLQVSLNAIYSILPNYGIAIIILTILMKILLFPLTHKSYESMKKMSALQPKMEEIKTQYKNNPDLMNKEIMNLYKKEGVNPLGGCLPMLMQMPLLIAMYGVLGGMIELKDAAFLWIKDLSSPDAVYTFNFTIPIIQSNTLNILPIIMTGLSILQAKLTPRSNQGSANQTQAMMWIMPLVFFFIFYGMASALVLYWTVQSAISVVQQSFGDKLWVFNKILPAKGEKKKKRKLKI